MCTALLIIIIYNSFKKNRVKIYAYIMHLVVARYTYYPYLLMKIIKMGLYDNPICIYQFTDKLITIVSFVEDGDCTRTNMRTSDKVIMVDLNCGIDLL